MRIFSCFLSLFYMSVLLLNSQSYQADEFNTMLKNKLRIQTPNAASLGQYGEIPIGLYTGVPEISIPLYEIVNGDIKVPIILKYHASGIKVNQEASWVGLGWALEAGGIITKIIRDEEEGFGDQCFPDIPPSPTVNNFELKLGDVQSLCFGNYFDPQTITGDIGFDTEPDFYIYNFLGNIGKFFYKRNGEFSYVKKDNIKFDRGDIYNLFQEKNPDYCWTATTIDGTKYFFDDLERSEEWIFWDNPKITPTMYLSNIISTNGRVIKFNYTKLAKAKTFPVYSELCHCISVNNASFSCDCNSPERKYTDIRIEPLFLNTIDFEIGIVKFAISDREDQYGKKLDTIKIFRKNETIPIKTIVFNYSYFTGSSYYGDCMSIFTDPDYNINRRAKRLKLDGIEIRDANNAIIQKYSFQYDNSKQLPYKSSYAIDYWGYFNGRSSNKSIIPDFSKFSRYNFQVYGVDLNLIGYGNNREPDVNYMKAGTLTKIIYPTGGYTVFDYEANEYTNTEWLDRQEKYAFVEAGTNEFEKVISLNPIVGIGERIYLVYVFECGSETTCNNYSEHYLLFKGIDQINSNISIRINSNTYMTKSGTLNLENIPSGNYRISAFKPTGDGYRAYLGVRWYENKKLSKATGPGIRIKGIYNYDSDGREVERKTYVYNNNDGTSSGKLMSVPLFARYAERTIGQCFWGPMDTIKLPLEERILTVFSSSIIPINNNQLGYSQVKEIHGANAEGGIIVSTFHNNIDDLVYYKSFIPGTPVVYDLANGNLLERIYLKKEGTQEKKVKAEGFQYYTISHKEWAAVMENGGNNCNDKRLYFHYYPVVYGENFLISKGEVYYNDNENISQKIVENYNYNNNMLVTSTTKEMVGGDSYVTLIKYPDNYYQKSSTAPVVNANDPRKEDMEIAHALWKLAQENIFNVPIEIVHKKNSVISDIELTTYKEFSFGTGSSIIRIKPYKIFKLESSQPLSSYTNSSISGNYFNYDKSILGLKYTHEAYDKFGNLNQASVPDGLIVSILSGYNYLYPIAEARNAAVNQIAYTSFEEGCPTGWTCSGSFALYTGTNTGKKIFGGSATLQSPTLPAGTYIVSFWAQGASQYSTAEISINGGNKVNPDDNTGGYYQKTITLTASGKITLSFGYIYIDEVRIYPSGAMMKTYTYDPLIGMTSATDENGKTTYYEYDSFGRLQYIRNQDREIVQEYKYHYKE